MKRINYLFYQAERSVRSNPLTRIDDFRRVEFCVRI